MKKSSIILWAALAIAAVGASSCTDESGFVDPTVNPQLPAMTASDLTVSPAIPATIDLTTYNNENKTIPFGTLTVTNLPEGYSIVLEGQVGREDTFEHSAALNATTVLTNPDVPGAYTINVDADDLEGAYVEAIGKSAKSKDAYFRFLAYAVKGNEKALIGNPENYVLSGKSHVTPLDLGIVIEDSYGLLGTINGWSVGNAVPFKHSGADVYDDPIFTMIVTITPQQAADGYWWKVVPQSTIATGNWVDAANASFGVAVNGSDALEGNLVPRTDTQDCGAGCIRQAGVYRLVLDMENQTYVWEPQASLLYVVGDLNGWNHNAATWLQSTLDGTEFTGFAKLTGSFKFTDKGDWSGTNYGAGEAAGKLSTDGGAGNLTATTSGLAFVKVDTNALTWSATAINAASLIGSFNGWSDLALTPNADKTVWTGTVTLADNDEFKVRFNNDWDINLGGNPDIMTVGGANMPSPGAGTYKVTVDITNVPFHITLTK